MCSCERWEEARRSPEDGRSCHGAPARWGLGNPPHRQRDALGGLAVSRDQIVSQTPHSGSTGGAVGREDEWLRQRSESSRKEGRLGRAAGVSGDLGGVGGGAGRAGRGEGATGKAGAAGRGPRSRALACDKTELRPGNFCGF